MIERQRERSVQRDSENALEEVDQHRQDVKKWNKSRSKRRLVEARSRLDESGVVQILDDLKQEFFPDNSKITITPNTEGLINFNPRLFSDVTASLIIGEDVKEDIKDQSKYQIGIHFRSFVDTWKFWQSQMALIITHDRPDHRHYFPERNQGVLAYTYLLEEQYEDRSDLEELMLVQLCQFGILGDEVVEKLNLEDSEYWDMYHGVIDHTEPNYDFHRGPFVLRKMK